MLRLTRKFLRFEPGPNLSTEVLGNALKAVPMSLEPCNLAGKRGWVKEFVQNRTFIDGALWVSKIAQTQALQREYFWGTKERAPILPDSPGDWKHLAEQASAEMNSEK